MLTDAQSAKLKTFKMNKVLQTILDSYGLTDIKKKDKREFVINAKKIYVKWLREEELKTYNEIGKELDRSHCAAMHLYKDTDRLVKQDTKANKVWHLLTNDRRCNESLEIIANIMDGIDNQDVYNYVIKQLPSIIQARSKFKNN